jgi:hypothetical protein
MSRIGLAFSCFFRILFGKKLPAAAAALLPEEALALPAPVITAAPAPVVTPVAAAVSAPAPAPAPAKKVDVAAHQREGALALLGLLQREGRLVDFVREPIDGFGDADIGAAARDIHRGCRQVIEEHFTLEAVLPGREEERVQVPKGFDPAEIRIIGEARGEPPFTGVLRHHGWRATQTKLPSLSDGVDRAVVAPAEVEVGAR